MFISLLLLLLIVNMCDSLNIFGAITGGYNSANTPCPKLNLPTLSSEIQTIDLAQGVIQYISIFINYYTSIINFITIIYYFINIITTSLISFATSLISLLLHNFYYKLLYY